MLHVCLCPRHAHHSCILLVCCVGLPFGTRQEVLSHCMRARTPPPKHAVLLPAGTLLWSWAASQALVSLTTLWAASPQSRCSGWRNTGHQVGHKSRERMSPRRAPSETCSIDCSQLQGALRQVGVQHGMLGVDCHLCRMRTCSPDCGCRCFCVCVLCCSKLWLPHARQPLAQDRQDTPAAQAHGLHR